MGRTTILEITTNNYYKNDNDAQLSHSYSVRRSGFRDEIIYYDTLKDAVLKICIEYKYELQSEVLTLFSE